tara:strand:- start:348 stop:629 length:282 start_codon:yes stop_codon:yes gene_type:complete
MIIIIIITTIIQALMFGFITDFVGKKKHIDGGFLWGFFLGIIGLLVIIGLPAEEKKEETFEEETPGGWETSNIDRIGFILFIILIVFIINAIW